MNKKLGITTIILALLTLVFVMASFADVPPPPVNQKIGIPDSIFNNLDEAGCRECHDDPDIVPPPPDAPGSGNVNRHHLLNGQPLQTGVCSRDSSIECLGDGQCPSDGRCSVSQTPCSVDTDCPTDQTCGQICVGDSIAPFLPDADGAYQCTTCHPIETNGDIVITTVRNCTDGGVGFTCHQQIVGKASVHHLTASAQNQDCVSCHGHVVDNRGDGHIIPTSETTLVTPAPSGGNGMPPNSRGNGAGACNYCHDSGMVTDPMFLGLFEAVQVFENRNNHHDTGIGLFDNSQCLWCHNLDAPALHPIRRCEQCHGFESLHNIAVDSDDADLVFNPAGTPNEENAGWSHVGNNDDCWGCHGYATAAVAPATGPVIPYINTTDATDVLAGSLTQVTCTGSSFVNTVDATTYSSTVVMTDANGIETALIPDSITDFSLTYTVPATLSAGNYKVRAAKADVRSNPVAIALIPDVTITSVNCDAKKGILVVTGTGFGDKPEGTDADLNVQINGGVVGIADMISWTDSQIKVSVDRCSNRDSVTVNALFGSASNGKPCKGKKCR